MARVCSEKFQLGLMVPPRRQRSHESHAVGDFGACIESSFFRLGELHLVGFLMAILAGEKKPTSSESSTLNTQTP